MSKGRCEECNQWFIHPPIQRATRCEVCVSTDCPHCKGTGRFPPGVGNGQTCGACDGKGKQRGSAKYQGGVDLTREELDDLRIVADHRWDTGTGRTIRLSERMMNKLLAAKPDLHHTLKLVEPGSDYHEDHDD